MGSYGRDVSACKHPRHSRRGGGGVASSGGNINLQVRKIVNAVPNTAVKGKVFVDNSG